MGFFFQDPAPTAIHTLSLHDALPIYSCRRRGDAELPRWFREAGADGRSAGAVDPPRQVRRGGELPADGLLRPGAAADLAAQGTGNRLPVAVECERAARVRGPAPDGGL